MLELSLFMKKMKFLFSLLFFCYAVSSAVLAEEPLFRFGLLADVQYADVEASEDLFYRNSANKLADAVKEFNQHSLTFVAHLGDLIDHDLKSYDPVLAHWKKLKTESHAILGNHDYDVDDPHKNQIPQKLGLKSNYYDFAKQGWRFIVLNGNDLSFHAHPKSSAAYQTSKDYFQSLEKKAINAEPYNGAIGDAQLKWMEQTVTNACQSGEKVIFLSHFPVFPKHRDNLWNDEEVLTLLEKHSCVFAYLAGHQHQGSYAVKKGIHHLTLKAVLLTEHKNAFAIATAYPERIEIKGYGREESRVLTFNAKDASKKVSSSSVQKDSGAKSQKIEALADSAAYHTYQKRSKSELSKLLFLLDRFRVMDLEIIYDGRVYDTEFALKAARKYLQKNYRKEQAMDWVSKHTYRSIHAGDVILLRFPGGEEKQLRDVFLNELEALEKLS